MAKEKPNLSFWQIWNLSFGFIGIQIGYSLQGTNTSRILSALGADPNHLPLFWVVAPIAGLIIQPIIGSASDGTWNRLGRRIPFILVGAIVSTLTLLLMPNSEMMLAIMPPVFFGVVMLLMMDASFNVTMQPFRSLVGDMVNDKQRNLGYSIQTFLTSIGAIIGSILPFLITYWGIRNVPTGDERVAPSVVWAFYIGAAILLPAVLWTCLRVKEYPPHIMQQYSAKASAHGNEKKQSILKSIPRSMYQLAVVQFFSWFGLFLVWVYATNAFAENIWHTRDPLSEGFNKAGNWFGVLNAIYAVASALFALFIARAARRWNRKVVYSVALLIGAIGLISMRFITSQYLLIVPMIAFGVAWSGILTIPYAILSKDIPQKRMGLFMGLFNMTITIPQILAGFTGGLLYKYVAGGSSMTMITIAGVSMLLAAISVAWVNDAKTANE